MMLRVGAMSRRRRLQLMMYSAFAYRCDGLEELSCRDFGLESIRGDWENITEHVVATCVISHSVNFYVD